jgi:Protein of unknown function (DUF3024).
MAFDAFTKKRVETILDRFIEAKIPKHLKDDYKIIYKFRGNIITLNQDCPSYMPGQRVELPIAQFRFEENLWRVYWKDSHDRWHFVEDIEPDTDFEKQLMLLDKPEFSYFWM